MGLNPTDPALLAPPVSPLIAPSAEEVFSSREAYSDPCPWRLEHLHVDLQPCVLTPTVNPIIETAFLLVFLPL